MARTRSSDYDGRREAIINQAARTFATTGFRGASMAELANACGVSKSLLYHYFPSKEDILFAVMASHIDDLVETVSTETERSADPADRLHHLIHKLMVDYAGAANQQKVLLNDLDNLPPKRRQVIVKKQRKIVAAFQSLLCNLDPVLARDAVRARAQTMLVLGILNWTHTWFDPRGPLSATDIADMASRLIMSGHGSAR